MKTGCKDSCFTQGVRNSTNPISGEGCGVKGGLSFREAWKNLEVGDVI